MHVFWSNICEVLLPEALFARALAAFIAVIEGHTHTHTHARADTHARTHTSI